ncbi:MAG: 5-(carboxyamino)imidazole ribonucleotide mutase [bacterium]|nr:5-(carboxyamino)imidazole ribonucleotide mutase [bacterium]
MSTTPVVGIVMGSDSDLAVMQEAADVCKEFGIPYEMRIVSAHRTPQDMADYATSAHDRGIKVIIAGAGGSAHLPGMIAAFCALPVIGVPIPTKQLRGLDSLMSIVQMPAGVPVATVAIGGGRNAGLLAAEMLAIADTSIYALLKEYKIRIETESREKNAAL